MQIFNQLNDWQQVRKNLPAHLSLGFVPTMGNLHAGHASLYEACRQENNCTVASIFINPTQFNQRNDFTNYPRTLEADLQLLRQLGVDYCLLPDEKSMYEEGYRYQIQENTCNQRMEGLQRPGHFTGVLTVVMKLFNLVKPHRAYFGEKDYQQYELIRDMAQAFFMDIDIKACPTIREASGLAFSSRNNRLSVAERKLAEQFARIFQKNISLEHISNELKTLDIEIEYLEEFENRRFAAVRVGEIRLIDNYLLS